MSDVAGRSSGTAGMVIVGLLVVVIAMCNGGGRQGPQSLSSDKELLPTPIEPEPRPVENAEAQFVSATALNQRSSPNGKVVGKLAGGDSVVVYERQGSWARVSPEGASARWVSSNLLCSGSGCYRPASKPSSRSPESSRRARSNYLDGGCPCSGSRVCIGPRGGRYCITSGGNKRYGV